MSNIIIYHHNLFDKVTGSSEKLLLNIALILNKTNNFNIWCLYNKNINTLYLKIYSILKTFIYTNMNVINLYLNHHGNQLI